MTAPKIELKKVEHAKSLSHETPAYTAQVWIDGAHFCNVENNGQGGCDMQYPVRGMTNSEFHPVLKAMNQRIAAEFPRINMDGFGVGEMVRDLEIVCHELLDEMAIAKDLERLLKRTIVFVDPTDQKIHSYVGKFTGVDRAHLITETARRKPGAVVLNNLPFAEALVIFKQQSAS